MKKEVSKIKQIIEKYNISFKNEKELTKWINKLNETEYNNLLRLEIDPKEITFSKEFLINKDLLNKKDYPLRIEAMSKIQCPSDCTHLMNNLMRKEFIDSKNYFLDLILLSKAKHIRYCFWLIVEMSYLNNKHHVEDMNLVANAEDSLVAQVLSEVAINHNSLQNRHHRSDMVLISKCSPAVLQPTHKFPSCSVNNLAINKVSLQDPFHDENMKILSNNKHARGYLYEMMTNPRVIHSQNYRREIHRLSKASSQSKARAIYYFIMAPQRTCVHDFFDRMTDKQTSIDYTKFDRSVTIKGINNSRYNFYLKLLNEIDDNYVMYISYLLTNKYLNESNYLDKDIRLILQITNKNIFVDLFKLMQNKNSLNSIHHIEDVNVLSKEENNFKRNLLLQVATNKDNLNSINHRYDMYFITTLDLSKLNEQNLNVLYYYLLNPKGINDKEHISKLESIYEQILNEEEIEKPKRQIQFNKILKRGIL